MHACELQISRVIGGLGRVWRRREYGRAEQVTVVESDHHGFDQWNANAKPAPSGGCYHHPFMRRELSQTIFGRVGEAIIAAGFVGRVHRDGCGFSRWGVRRRGQVKSGESKMFGAIPTEVSSMLTTQRTRELLCRRLRCLSGLKTWFVGPPDAAVQDRFARSC